MRAMVLERASHALVEQKLPVPEPGPTELLVRVRCTGVPVRLWVGQLRDGTLVAAAVVGIFLLEDKPSDERIAQLKQAKVI